MKNILVFARNYNLGKPKYGFKWGGFCNGKRFTVLLDPYQEEKSFNSEKGVFIVSNNEQLKLLPDNILRMLRGVPLSNEYFILGKELELTTEIVFEIIEFGYEIDNVYLKRGFRENYLYRYIDKENNSIIVEILEDYSIIWKGILNDDRCLF